MNAHTGFLLFTQNWRKELRQFGENDDLRKVSWKRQTLINVDKIHDEN